MTELFQNYKIFKKIFINYPSNVKKNRIRKLSAHDLR